MPWKSLLERLHHIASARVCEQTIRLGGAALPVTWTGDETWQVEVPLQPGDNPITLVAADMNGAAAGRDSITVRYQ